MAPNQLLQHKAQLSQSRLQPQAKAQHQLPSAGRRSHRTLPKDQTQLLSLQHDHRHREKERQRQREMPVAALQKLTANSGNTAATAATAAAPPSRSPVSQRSAVNPAFLSLLVPCPRHPTLSCLFVFSQVFSSCSLVRTSCKLFLVVLGANFQLLQNCDDFISLGFVSFHLKNR